MAVDPNNLGGKVTTSQTMMSELVQKMWGSEYHAPDHGVYVMSGNRRFDSTDKGRTGVYGVEVSDGLLIRSDASDRYPDMYHGVVLDDDGDKITQEG